MRILYSIPSPHSVYAARFVYEGMKNAFIALGHEFRPYTSEDDLADALNDYKPDIFLYSLNFYHLKFLDLPLLNTWREDGLVVFCQIRAWHHVSSGGVAAGGLKDHRRERDLVTCGLAGDVYWHWFEQDEPLMDGFVEATGRRFETIHQAADATLYFPDRRDESSCDLAYVGSYLPAKRRFLRENVLPLRRRYDLRIHGSDWTFSNRLLKHVQRTGQYFNIRPLKEIRKLSLSIEDERQLYSSARICLNVHEEQVRRTGCEINERTFKVLACGGFQLCDNVRLLRRFFSASELVIADGGRDWFDKVDYYLNHPEERATIAEAGRRKVLSRHTYHHRATDIMSIAARVRSERNKNRRSTQAGGSPQEGAQDGE